LQKPSERHKLTSDIYNIL